MLILSRKEGESVHIGDGITVQVLEIRGDKVRLGFVAPDELPIFRDELVTAGMAEMKRPRRSNARATPCPPQSWFDENMDGMY